MKSKITRQNIKEPHRSGHLVFQNAFKLGSN